MAESFVQRAFEGSFEKSYRALTERLDTHSRNTVERVLDAHRYLYCYNLLDRRKLFTSEELSKQAEYNKNGALRRLALDLGITSRDIEASVLWHHHGLRDCPQLPEGLHGRFQGKVVLDVGAAAGDSAKVFSTFYSPSCIYSFEPDPKAFAKLSEMVAEMPVGKVRALPFGAGSQCRVSGGLEIRTIDSVVGQDGLDVGLIKMDIEGEEIPALLGARNTILSQKPLLIISIYHNGDQFFDTLPLIRGMRSDYSFYVTKLDARSPVGETMLIAV